MIVDLSVYSAYGPAGPSSRARLHDWLTHLDLHAEIHDYLGSASVGTGELVSRPVDVVQAELSLRRAARRPASTVLLSRSASPFSRGGVEERLLRRSPWGVYDFDDALWVDVRGGIHRLFAKPVIWSRAVAAADQVIAGSEYLADRAATINKNVAMIPTCVEPRAYRQKSSYELGSPPRIVWLGSPSTERYLLDISDALQEVNRLRGARVTVISAGAQAMGGLEDIVDRVQWSLDSARQLLAQADIGVMPLPDDAYARGKCAYKLLEYGAAGLPVVASPVGANIQAVERMGGRLAGGSAEWIDALIDMLDAAPNERESVGHRARTAVFKHYSFAVWEKAFREALQLGTDDSLRLGGPGTLPGDGAW